MTSLISAIHYWAHDILNKMYQTAIKSIFASLFNNYITYFNKININQLTIEFAQGQAELQNLSVRQDALRQLHMPWDVKSGTIGTLVIRIPLFSFLSEPWDIILTDLILVVTPSNKSQIKIQEVSILDEPSLAEELKCNSEKTKLAEFYKSFSTMVRNLVGNLRLKIDSIKIIFENSKARFEADKVSLARTNSERRLVMNNASIYVSVFGFDMNSCDFQIRDVAPGELQNSYEFISNHDIAVVLFIEPSTPMANFLLEDFRLLFYSSDQQQDGSIFARVSCCHFDKVKSSWENLLDPWPFNLSWDKRKEIRRFSLTSDEHAELSIDSAFLDILDAFIGRISEPKIAHHQHHLIKRSISYKSSPKESKLTHYNYQANLAQRIGAASARQLFHHATNSKFDMNFIAPGIKVSLLDHDDEKFVVIMLEDIVIHSTEEGNEQMIDCSVHDVKIENMLPDCVKFNVLHRESTTNNQSDPAFRLIIDRILGRSFGTVWFKQFQISTCDLSLNIEETLFMKIVEFIRLRKPRRDMNRIGILRAEEHGLSRYYFDLLRIDLSSLQLSVVTASNLPENLQQLKTQAGLKFFGFEDAQLDLEPYIRMNKSGTLGEILDSVTRFYMPQISEQVLRVVVQQIQEDLIFTLSDSIPTFYDDVYSNLYIFLSFYLLMRNKP